jgi:hypothetical protein
MQRQDRKRGVERLLRERERFRRTLNDTRGPGVPLLDHPPGRFNCNDSPVSRLICTGPCSHIHHGPGIAEPTHDRGSDPGVGLACGGIRATDPIVNSLAHSVNFGHLNEFGPIHGGRSLSHQVDTAARPACASGQRVQRLSGFEPCWFHPKNLMFQGFEIENHGARPARRRYVHVFSEAPKSRVAVPVNMNQTRVAFKEPTQRLTSNATLSEAGIQNTQHRTVRDENRVGINEARQRSQVGVNVRVGLFEDTAHERQRILISHEMESPKCDSPAMNRLDPGGAGIELYEVIVAHDVQDGHAGCIEHIDNGPRFVPLRILGRIEPIRATQQISTEENHLDVVLAGGIQ